MKRKLILLAVFFLIGIGGWGNVMAACIYDPVSYWTLDQNTQPFTNEILDGPEGMCVDSASCPTSIDDGMVNYAQSFDGTTDGISIADDGNAVFDFQPTDSFSIGVWFRRDASTPLTTNEVVVGRYSNNNSGQTHFWLGINTTAGVTTGNATFRLWDSSAFTLPQAQRSIFGRVLGTTVINDGDWHYMVAVRNGAGNQNLLYVDGQLEGTGTFTYSGTFTADAPVYLGRMGADYYFPGDIDEVTIFDSALSQNMIAEIYQAGVTGTPLCSENEAPEITSTAGTEATVGQEYVYEPEAYDPDGDDLTWSLVNPPSGMEIVEQTGVITWTPTADSGSSVSFHLSVTDSFEADQEAITITVNGGSDTNTDTDSNGSSSNSSSSEDSSGCFISTSTPTNYRFLTEVAGALAFLMMLVGFGIVRRK